jgi:hypothetical protein
MRRPRRGGIRYFPSAFPTKLVNENYRLPAQQMSSSGQKFVNILSADGLKRSVMSAVSGLCDSLFRARLCRLRHSTLQVIAQVVIQMVMIAALLACGAPKAQAPAIMLTFGPIYPLPTSLTTGSKASIEVLVTNDNKNAGVNFTSAPDTPARACGQFSQPSAGSNGPSCYRPLPRFQAAAP